MLQTLRLSSVSYYAQLSVKSLPRNRDNECTWEMLLLLLPSFLTDPITLIVTTMSKNFPSNPFNCSNFNMRLTTCCNSFGLSLTHFSAVQLYQFNIPLKCTLIAHERMKKFLEKKNFEVFHLLISKSVWQKLWNQVVTLCEVKFHYARSFHSFFFSWFAVK